MTGRTGEQQTSDRPDVRDKSIRSFWREYLAISPFYVLFAVFGIFPLIYGIYLSTQKWDGLGPSTFVGFDQFVRLFNDSQFYTSVFNTVAIFIIGLVPAIIGALLAACILSQAKLRASGFYQTLLFLPQMTSLVAVAIVFQSLFGNNFGLINHFLTSFGFGALPWLSNTWLVKIVIACMVIWRGLGYFMVVFLAGIAAIPSEIYDAGKVDGAGAVRSFWSLTLPLLRPSIVFVALIGTISGFHLFTEPNVLFPGTGGPNNSGLSMMLLQVQYFGGSAGIRIPDLGYATVVGWAVFVILLGVSVFNSRLLRSAEAS